MLSAQPTRVQKTVVHGTLPHPLALPCFVVLPRRFLSLRGHVIDILFRAVRQVFFFLASQDLHKWDSENSVIFFFGVGAYCLNIVEHNNGLVLFGE